MINTCGMCNYTNFHGTPPFPTRDVPDWIAILVFARCPAQSSNSSENSKPSSGFIMDTWHMHQSEVKEWLKKKHLKHFTTSPTHEEADGIHGHLHNWPHTLWAFFCLGRILPTSCKNHGQVARESAVRWPSRIPKSQQWGANAFGTWRPRFNNHTAPLVSLWIKSSWCCETPTKGQPCSILEGERKAKSHLKLFNILSFELGCNPIWLMWPCLILWLQTSNLLFHSSPISSTWPMSWSSSKGQKSHISSAKCFNSITSDVLNSFAGAQLCPSWYGMAASRLRKQATKKPSTSNWCGHKRPSKGKTKLFCNWMAESNWTTC